MTYRSGMLAFINSLNHLPIAYLWIMQVVASYGLLLVMLRIAGATGVTVMMVIIMIAANIQVLKPIMLPFYSQPVPLGTALFATNYLASDILIEYFGVDAAKRAVTLTIWGFIIMLVFMMITLGFHPLSMQQIHQFHTDSAIQIQNAMFTIFSPTPILLMCSLFSFFISQFAEISLFVFIKNITGQKALWLRNNISTWVAALVDNIVFNVLAWRIFASSPVSWHTLIAGYIFGTYALRIALAVFDTPFIYLAKYFIKPEKNNQTQAAIPDQ